MALKNKLAWGLVGAGLSIIFQCSTVIAETCKRDETEIQKVENTGIQFTGQLTPSDRFGERNLGSGVIIGQRQREYFVVTAYHVVKNGNKYFFFIRSSGSNSIETPPFIPVEVDIKDYNQEQDIALLTFENTARFERPGFANHINGQCAYVFGFPEKPKEPEESKPSRSVHVQITDTQNTNNRMSYNMDSDYPTTPGMSGGSVLNLNQEMLGIHLGENFERTVATGRPINVILDLFSKYWKTPEQPSTTESPIVIEFSPENRPSEFQKPVGGDG